jgi:hypothetical protein
MMLYLWSQTTFSVTVQLQTLGVYRLVALLYLSVKRITFDYFPFLDIFEKINLTRLS